MSQRSSLLDRLSYTREGFQEIPDGGPANMSRNDATIDIPLTTVTSQTGNRRVNGDSSSARGSADEKSTFFKRRGGGGGGGGLRKKQGTRLSASDGEALTGMGKIYNAVLNFSIVTRYFVYVLPLALIIAVPIIVGATAAQGASFGGVRIVWIFTWVEIVWLSLWVSKLFAKALPHIFQFFCGIVSAGTRKYALVLSALEIPLSLAGWALTALATFIPLMTRNPDQVRQGDTGVQHWQTIVSEILAALLVSSLIFLAEKFLVQLISISYHRMQYDLKIKESKHNVYLLSLLYDASRELFPEYCPEFAEEDYVINDSIQLGVNGHSHGHARSGSATPLRLLQNVGRMGDKLTAAFGNVAHEITGKQVFNPTSAHSIVVEALERNSSSEALAKRIWMSFVVEGKEALYQEDVIEVLGMDHKEHAAEAFAALDRDGNGDISLDEMILTVCNFGRDRKSIARSLHDVDSAINVLENLLIAIVFIICIFVFVAFLNASFTTTLATAGTALLSMSFVFASTAAEVLGSCIFIFVKHPFDCGDRVDINGEQLVVERMSLLFTVFRSVADNRNTQVPNIVLNSLWIDNLSRSGAMTERLLMYISFDTTLEDIQLLRDEIQKFVSDKENSRDFQSDVDVEVTGIAEMNKMELKVEIRHKSNWSNETVRAARRSKFMCALVLALRKVPIYAPGGGGAALGSADQPTYSVSVSDTEAAERRQAFAQAKEEKRFVPTTKPSSPSKSQGLGVSTGIHDASSLRQRSPSIAPASETAALTALNSRNPASDPAQDGGGNVTGRSPGTPTEADDVRDMLRRQSTRGKRRGNPVSPQNSAMARRGQNGVPTIQEPGSQPYLPYPTPLGAPRLAHENGSSPTLGIGVNPYLQQTPHYDMPPSPAQQQMGRPPTANSANSRTQGNSFAADEDARRREWNNGLPAEMSGSPRP